jgi:hypothetical protein
MEKETIIWTLLAVTLALGLVNLYLLVDLYQFMDVSITIHDILLRKAGLKP